MVRFRSCTEASQRREYEACGRERCNVEKRSRLFQAIHFRWMPGIRPIESCRPQPPWLKTAVPETGLPRTFRLQFVQLLDGVPAPLKTCAARLAETRLLLLGV